MQPGQLFISVLLSCEETKIKHLQHLLAENGSKLSTVIAIQSETTPNREIFISLTEFADSTTCKNFVFCCLEIWFHYESSIINQPIFMNNVEDFPIDIYQTRCNKEGTRSVKFLPLLLLQ
jgi:hypothetical protein